MDSTNLNIHIYPSTLENESRILRLTQSLAEHRIFSSIVIVGYRQGQLPEYESLDGTRTVWRIPLKPYRLLGRRLRRLFRYLEWLLRIVKRFRKEKIEVVNCHSIYDLPAGVVLKKLTGCKLIYDTHELETERNGMKGVIRGLAKLIERRAIARVDHVFVVSESIAGWYCRRYGLTRVNVIRNIPSLASLEGITARDWFRQEFDIPATHLIFLYQGALLPGRGIELLLNIFSGLPADRHVVFMGYGPLLPLVLAASQVHPGIHLRPAVPVKQVLEFTMAADVGISLIENVCLSYYYSLPNKIFEYVLAGLPCLVSDFPDMAAFVDRYQCGWKTAPEREMIFPLISNLTREEIDSKKIHIRAIRADLNWEREESRLMAAYTDLLRLKPGSIQTRGDR